MSAGLLLTGGCRQEKQASHHLEGLKGKVPTSAEGWLRDPAAYASGELYQMKGRTAVAKRHRCQFSGEAYKKGHVIQGPTEACAPVLHPEEGQDKARISCLPCPAQQAAWPPSAAGRLDTGSRGQAEQADSPQPVVPSGLLEDPFQAPPVHGGPALQGSRPSRRGRHGLSKLRTPSAAVTAATAGEQSTVAGLPGAGAIKSVGARCAAAKLHHMLERSFVQGDGCRLAAAASRAGLFGTPCRDAGMDWEQVEEGGDEEIPSTPPEEQQEGQDTSAMPGVIPTQRANARR